MKEISVEVCLNDYTWLEICEKKMDCLKRPSKKKLKKNGLEQKQKKKNREKKEVEVQFELYFVKFVEFMIFEKKIVLH